MTEHDIDARLRAGSQLVGWGIVVLALALVGTCGAAVAGAGDPNSAARGLEIGQSPWLLIALTAGIALIVVGQVRKSNARRDEEERFRRQHTTIDVVLDEEAPGGPFRGAMKEVEVLNPVIAEAERVERERAHRRGSTYLAIGGAVLLLTVVGMLMASGAGDDSPQRAAQRILTAFGLAVFPFGIGLFFAIKGLILRTK